MPEGQYVDVINIQISPAGRSPGQVIVVLDVLPPDCIRQFVSRDEGGIVVLPDGTVKIIVQPLSPPRDVDIELMKVNLQAHGQPPGEQERVVVAIESNMYEPDGDTPEDVAYTPAVELWVELPEEDAAACDESRARVYSVKSGAWSLIEHRCETDESDKVWAVAEVERLGAFALVIDDAPVVATPTPVAAAVAAMPTTIPASAPAVIVQRISLPAQPPTPTPNAVPTAVPVPVGKPTVATSMDPTPTPTAVPESSEPPCISDTGLGSRRRFRVIGQNSHCRARNAPIDRRTYCCVPPVQGRSGVEITWEHKKQREIRVGDRSVSWMLKRLVSARSSSSSHLLTLPADIFHELCTVRSTSQTPRECPPEEANNLLLFGKNIPAGMETISSSTVSAMRISDERPLPNWNSDMNSVVGS